MARNYVRLALLIFLISIFATGCNSKAPDVTTLIELSNLSEDDYKKFNHAIDQSGLNVGDLKKLIVKVDLTGLKPKLNRSIQISDLYVIDRYDRIRTVTGGEYERNNVSFEDSAEAMKFVVFDAKGLKEEELRNIFKNATIKVRWLTRKGEEVKRDISIGESMMIKVN